MTISSAYIFGKQLKSIDPPMPDDVYFENGRFNPLYVGNSFNFNDSDIKRDSYDAARIAALNDRDFINAHKVIQAVGTNSAEWIIEDGELVRKMTSPYTSSDDNASCVFIPINIATSQLIAYQTKINVSIQQTDVDSPQYDNTKYEIYILDSWNDLDRVMMGDIGPSGTSSGYVNYAAEMWRRSDPTYPPPYYIVFYASAIKEVRIKKIWFTDLNTQ